MFNKKKRKPALTYRRDYLKKNKGIAGTGVYTCAYCAKLCFGASSVHIDHIYPKSEMVFKVSKNATANLVTSCPKCNQRKSNKVSPMYITRGYMAKVVQTVLYNRVTGLAALAYVGVIGYLALTNTSSAVATVPALALGALAGFNKKIVWALAAVSVVASVFM